MIQDRKHFLLLRGSCVHLLLICLLREGADGEEDGNCRLIDWVEWFSVCSNELFELGAKVGERMRGDSVKGLALFSAAGGKD